MPWPQDGEQPSYVNIHYVVKLLDEKGNPRLDPKGRPLQAVPGRACRSVDEAARTIEWATQNLSTDVYICMSAQQTAEQKTSRKGKTYLQATRKRENVARLKSLFIDVDVKPEDLKHGYATVTEAVTEFARIRKELGLPPQSFVVRSGSGGFHAHWTFTEPVDPARWAKLSAALAAGFLAKGFRGDTQCIVDIVRLLRVPGTWNWKTGEPRPVTQLGTPGPDYFVDVLEKPLATYVGMHATPTISKPAMAIGNLGALPAALRNLDLRPLDAGLDELLPAIDEVAAGCPFITRTLTEAGKSNNNPLWLQTTNVAMFCKDAKTAVHRMSSGYPTYSIQETDTLYDRQRDTKLRRNLGWPRCATIAGFGAPECSGCVHLQAGRSPLNYVARFQPAPAQAPAGVPAAPPAPGQIPLPSAVTPLVTTLAILPQGYGYDQNNIICTLIPDPGDPTKTIFAPLCHFVMEKPWLQQDPPVLHFFTATHIGHERQIRLPYEVIADKSSFPKFLAKQGMLVDQKDTRDLGGFFVAWIDKMRSDRSNIVQSQPYGWHVKDGKLSGFVYAGYVWSKDVPRPAANPDPVLGSQYTPLGDLGPWAKAGKMITDQQRPALNAIVAAAFAAPLVRFTGQSGVLMSAFSKESGIGKSSALKVAQSVWGSPIKSMQSLSDTINSVLKKIGDTKNLPLFWDELKEAEDTQKFVNLAFQLSLGKEKSRLTADTSYREPGTWQTLLCSCSNDSLLSFILSRTKTTTAGLYRVFEFTVEPGKVGQISGQEAALILGALNENYGHAGLTYAQFLGGNHERIAQEVADYGKALEEAYHIRPDERFWLALITTIICGANYANELGLTNIDVAGLAKFMVDRMQDMRNQRITSPVDINIGNNITAYLARYMNEHRQNNTVVTNIIHRAPSKPPRWQPNALQQAPGCVWPLTSDAKIRSVRIQIGQDDHWIRLFKTPFEEWLIEQRVTPALIIKQLTEQFGVKEFRGKLCSGTLYATAAENCLEFNHADPVWADMIEI